MRTTLDLDEAILSAARALARADRVSLGVAVSRLAMRGLNADPLPAVSSESGFPVFRRPDRAAPITVELVTEHRDGS